MPEAKNNFSNVSHQNSRPCPMYPVVIKTVAGASYRSDLLSIMEVIGIPIIKGNDYRSLR